jgi:predicted GNAT family N-acyltransferase
MLLAEARQRGDQSVLLHAQTSVVGFYQRFGFVGYGDEFIEAGIPHQLMRYDFA